MYTLCDCVFAFLHADPCADGIMNYNETDVDCGGPLCLPCDQGQVGAL